MQRLGLALSFAENSKKGIVSMALNENDGNEKMTAANPARHRLVIVFVIFGDLFMLSLLF